MDTGASALSFSLTCESAPSRAPLAFTAERQADLQDVVADWRGPAAEAVAQQVRRAASHSLHMIPHVDLRAVPVRTASSPS